MASINDYLNQIRSAVYGEEVRGSIVNAITAMNNESSSAKVNANNATASVQEVSQNVDGLREDLNKVESQLTESITELRDDLDNKLDKGGKKTENLIDLSKFVILPSEYYITDKTINGVDYRAISQNPITVSNIWSLLNTRYTEVEYRFNYSYTYIVLCANRNFALAFNPSLSSENVKEYTKDTTTHAPGIYINEGVSPVAVGDKIKYARQGTKVAIYVLRNGIYTKVFREEWVDIAKEYPSLSAHYNFETDINFGIVTQNAHRHEANIYDATCSLYAARPYTTKTDLDNLRAEVERDYASKTDLDNLKVEVERDYTTKTEFEDLKGEIEASGKVGPKTIDLFMFMGQSNMAGRGTAEYAPTVASGVGYEFKAVSDPTKLYDAVEPFGRYENVSGGIYDGYSGTPPLKSGSMVSALMIEYYNRTRVPIVGVSASEGGTRIGYWLPTPIGSTSSNRYNDAKQRFDTAITWLNANGYTIRHKYMLWCQGESDGDDNLSASEYKSRFETMANAWFANGIEKIFVVRIGNNRDNSILYDTIMQAQNEICQTYKNVVMVSTEFAKMASLGLMSDEFHYNQTAYNTVGTNAGKNCAYYVINGKEPTMWDSEFSSLYYSHKDD